LAASKALRPSDDTYVSKNVYINPELSPVEEKMAYERRLQRRRHATAPVTATVLRQSTSLNVDAEPYVDRSAAVAHSATLSVSTTTGTTGDSLRRDLP